MNGQQMLKRDFVGDLTPREGRTRRATSIAAKHAAGSPVTLVTDRRRLARGARLSTGGAPGCRAGDLRRAVLRAASERPDLDGRRAQRAHEPHRASRSDLVRGCGCAGGDPAPRPGAAHAGERGRAQPAGSRARGPRAVAQRRGHRAAHRPARRAGRIPRAVPERDLGARDRGGGAAHPRPARRTRRPPRPGLAISWESRSERRRSGTPGPWRPGAISCWRRSTTCSSAWRRCPSS